MHGTNCATSHLIRLEKQSSRPQRDTQVVPHQKTRKLIRQNCDRYFGAAPWDVSNMLAALAAIGVFLFVLSRAVGASDLKVYSQQHDFESAFQAAIDSGRLISDDIQLRKMVTNGIRERYPSALYVGLMLTFKSESALDLGDIALADGLKNASLLLVTFAADRLNFRQLKDHVRQLENYASPNPFLVQVLALNGMRSDTRSLTEIVKSLGTSARAAAQYGSPIALQLMSKDVNRTPDEHAFACSTLALLEVKTATQKCSDVPQVRKPNSGSQRDDIVNSYRVKLSQFLGSTLFNRYNALCKVEFSDLGDASCFDFMSVADAFCTVQVQDGNAIWRSQYSVCDSQAISLLADLFIMMNNDLMIVGIARR